MPFYFYKTVDVQTGGYPAEFGRATGGVINATTKQGTNDAFIAFHVDWEPKSLQSHRPNVGDPTFPTSIGNTISSDKKQATLEAGGAIIPDHLFIYGLIQANRNERRGAFPTLGYYAIDKDKDPFWGGKLDAYINPTQHFEFTIFDTRSNTEETRYNFTPNADFTDVSVGSVDRHREHQDGRTELGCPLHGQRHRLDYLVGRLRRQQGCGRFHSGRHRRL